MLIGEVVKNKRKERNISQEELACLLNVSRPTVSDWERNIVTPNVENVVSMAEIFGCSIDELFGKKLPFAKSPAKTKGKASLK